MSVELSSNPSGKSRVAVMLALNFLQVFLALIPLDIWGYESESNIFDHMYTIGGLATKYLTICTSIDDSAGRVIIQ